MAKGNKAEVTNESPIDFSDYLPSGFGAEEVKKTGGLPPMYRPEKCWNVKDKEPVVGWLLGIRQMPPADGRDWEAIGIELTGPANVCNADGDVVRAEKGDLIFLPISGALAVNDQLRAACYSEDKVYLGIFRIKGQRDTGQPSKMWDYEVLVHEKTIPRTGAHALYNTRSEAKALPSGREQTASA